MSKFVKMDTSAGTLRIELDDEKAPLSTANFLAYVQQGPLRRHGVPPRHQGLHGPGRRLRARHEAEAHRRADPQRGQQRPEEQALHAGHGAHQRPALGIGAVLRQHHRQRLPRLPRRERPGLGLRGVRPRRRGHRRGRQDRERAHRPQGHARRRAAGRRAHRARHRGRADGARRRTGGRRAGRRPGRCRPSSSSRRRATGRRIDFISDLHLCEATAAHLRGLGRAPAAHAGRCGLHPRRPVRGLGRRRCAHLPFERRCVEVLAEAASHRSLAFMAGNRDFLLGAAHAARQRHDGPARPHACWTPGASACCSATATRCAWTTGPTRPSAPRCARPPGSSSFLARPLAERLAVAAEIRSASARAAPLRRRRLGRRRRRRSRALDARRWARPNWCTATRTGPAATRWRPGFKRHVLSDWDLDQGRAAPRCCA